MNWAYGMLHAGMWLASLPPLGLARALGAGLGRTALRLDARHRGIILDNLRLSFPEREEAWLQATARDCFAHLGQVACEIPRLVRLSPQQVLAKTRQHGLENLEQARALGKGVLLLTGHIGNWEWSAVASGLAIKGACLVARPLDWPPADRLVQYWRTKGGNSVVPKSRSARAVLKELKRGGLVAVMLDQNVDWYDGEWVDFFGRPACTNKGLALLAMTTGAPVVPFYGFRAPDGLFDMYFEAPAPMRKTGDKLQDVWDNTQLYTKALEEIIRQHPEQWFWLHQRWKTKPFHAWPRRQ